ncbi:MULTISPECIES: AAA family ATPase [unclassified Marinovum]
MKLRTLELTNVRRFAGQKAQLGPFGDGLTTITAENESGKSTFFDALHALFFVAHNSTAQEVKKLQPYSGGAVSVAAEIEVDGRNFRIEKTFLAQKSAKVIDVATGQVVKQQGDAEAWIEDNINRANKGPTGLLWVRQGAIHVDPEGKDRDASNVAARRDLMSSVRGQIDAVTGGRRMDVIVERCRSELAALATKSLKAKAGSPWKQVEDRVDELQERKARLEAEVASLSKALEVKRRTKTRLRDLQDPAKQAERTRQLEQAFETLQQAEQHDRSVTDADKALRIIAAEKDRLLRLIKDITDAQDRRNQLAQEISEKRGVVMGIEAAQKDADQKLTEGLAEIKHCETERRGRATALKDARLAQKKRVKWARMHALAELSASLVAPQMKLAEAEAVLHGPDIAQSDLDHLGDLSRRISIAKEQRRAQFASFTIQPSGTDSATLDGRAVPPGEMTLIDRPLDVHIPNFGEVCLRPAATAGQGIEDPEALQAEYDAALAGLGFNTLTRAREVFHARERAANDKEVALAMIRGLAPDGTDALTEEWHALCADLGHPPEEQPPAAAQETGPTAEQIEDDIARLDDRLDSLRTQSEALQKRATEAAGKVAEANGVLNHLLAEQTAAAKPEGEDSQLAALETARDGEVEKETLAAQTLATLKRDAPDLEVAKSAHNRLQSAVKGDQDEINRLERELAHVNGVIVTQSEDAVEEKLAEVNEQLARATERAARYEMQAKALTLLIDHLDTARKDAQETYFEPIRTELRPLLAQLHAGAEFELDPEKMLVGKIIRNGIEDDVTVLSGGAYEQIAILTRLAFAKLFAKQGRHVPVILDDALVHTDDERISTMFNMLSQVARDQQIIVLSCRTRAFSDLGGTRAFIETEAV